MANIRLTFGQTIVTKDGKIKFPPENAKSIESVKGKETLEINLVSDREQGMDR